MGEVVSTVPVQLPQPRPLLVVPSAHLQCQQGSTEVATEGLATEVVPPWWEVATEALVMEVVLLVAPSAHPQCQQGSTEEVLARPPWQRLSWAPAMASRQPIIEGPRTFLFRHPVSMTTAQLSIDGIGALLSSLALSSGLD